MPVFLLIAGALFAAAALNDKTDELAQLTGEAFAPKDGAPSFIVWVVAIFLIGAVGYIKAARPFSHMFLVLALVSLFLANGGFFDKFTQAIKGLNK